MLEKKLREINRRLGFLLIFLGEEFLEVLVFVCFYRGLEGVVWLLIVGKGV